VSVFQKALDQLQRALAEPHAQPILEALSHLESQVQQIAPEDGPALWAAQIELNFLHRFYTQRQQLRLPPSGLSHVHDCLARA